MLRSLTSIRPRGLPRQPRLAQGRERNPLVEHMETVALDLVEEGLINRRHHQPRSLRSAVADRETREGHAIHFSCTDHLLAHQCLERGGKASVENVAVGYAMLRQLVLRE